MMTEIQYMLAANVARVRALRDLLSMVDSAGDFERYIPDGEYHGVRRMIRNWEARLDKALDLEMHPPE